MKRRTLLQIVANLSPEDQVFLKKYLELKDSNTENILEELGIEDDSLPSNRPKYAEKLSISRYNYLISIASQVSEEVADELNAANFVQCPKCNHGKMRYVISGGILESLPPQRRVCCTLCDNIDLVIHFGVLYETPGPKNPII